ncbi:non-heme iron oxygenase ferredoxin subunit [Rhizocola hellebori]|uniref:Non-heme iron oxygenase ferredoxin subunit n=1 Tax=Rhizocola hellebori TaxID=1392758 RepID=A0A8J3Q7Z4_9ACTN|nr:non-heme iron oxygenase ferredoxin subunit [Rhizocola hellebori]GIH05089.1 non-heme iron oxygenase ferredoxin subunit [Rhizocola hellebori]
MKPVAQVEDLPKGKAMAVEVDGVSVAVVHTAEDEFYAIYDQCSHAAVPLSDGEVDGCTLECWLHGSRFDLRTGEPTGLPAIYPVQVFPVEIRDGEIYVDVNGAKQ